jgi:hypothetical protein
MSVINDKFNIISFPDKKIKVYDVVNSYIENLIINNRKCISSGFIHQILWNDLNIKKETNEIKLKKSIDNVLEKHLSLYLKQKRNEFRIANKKGRLNIRMIIDFMIDYIKILKKIKESLKIVDKKDFTELKAKQSKIYGYSTFIDTGVSQFCKKILSDNIVISLIEKKLQEETFDYLTFKEFYKIVDNFSMYYSENKLWFSNLLSKILKDMIPRNDYSVLSLVDNGNKIIQLYKFDDLNNYYTSCKNKFKFIKDDTIFEDVNIEVNDMINSIINFNIKNTDKKTKIFILKYCINFIKNNLERVCSFVKFKEDNIYKLSAVLDLFDPQDYKNTLYSFEYYNIMSAIILDSCCWIFRKKITDKLNTNESLSIIFKIVNDNIISLYDEESEVISINYKNDAIYSILSKLKNNDFIISELKKYLALRLLNIDEDFDKKQSVENKDFDYLEKYFEKKHIFDISKMYYDFNVSNRLLNDYLEISCNEFKGKSIVTSYDTWDVNLSEGSMHKLEDIDFDPNESVFYHYYQYSKFYKLKYKNKRFLINHPHLGSLKMTFNCQKKVNLIMLPIHGIILELIEKNKIIVKDKIIKKIKSFSSYSEKFINQLISSLIDTEIILIGKVGKGMITINYDYNKLDEIDVSKFFFQNSYLDNKWDEERKESLALSRENIVSTLINSFIKKNERESGNKFVSRENIFKNISNELTLFKIDQKLYKKVLDYLVKKDYISYNKEIDSYCKLYY